MTVVSDAFREAIVNGAPQTALLRFGNAVFTNEDIDVSSGGLVYEDRFNEYQEFTVGTTPSSSISVSLLQSDMELNGFQFGEFNAMLGVQTGTEHYNRAGLCTADYRGRTFNGMKAAPYLLENGAACRVQPNFAVYGIMIIEGAVYCIGRNSELLVFDITTYAARNNTWGDAQGLAWNDALAYTWAEFSVNTMLLNPVMRRKLDTFASERIGMVLDGTSLKMWYADGMADTYEMTSLGWFEADRPAHLDGSTVSIEAFDRMDKLDVKLKKLNPIQYPISHRDLALFLCNACGVPVETSGLINAGLMLYEEPNEFYNATARDVIGYIAGASASIAKFDRNGVLHFRLFVSSSKRIDRTEYGELSICSYNVKAVDGLVLHQSGEDDLTVGSTINPYVMSGNPLMPQNADVGTAVLEKLSGVGNFAPINVTAYTDWTTQAGDIITVDSSDGAANGRAYGQTTYSMPVYSTKVSWDGFATVTHSNSGEETRPEEDRDTRRNEAFEDSTVRNYYGLGSRLTDQENVFDSYCEATDKHLKELDDGTVEMWTRIYQDSERIELTARKVTLVENKTQTLETKISQTASDITLYAKKDELVSLINISAEGIKINADKLDIEAQVTITQLSAVEAKIDNLTSGQATANSLSTRALTTGGITMSTSGVGTYSASWARITINGVQRIVMVGD